MRRSPVFLCLCLAACSSDGFEFVGSDASPEASPDATGGTGGTGTGGTGGTSGTGGVAGHDAGDGEDEPPCDASLLPSEDACVIDGEYGIFVSPSGQDDAACGGEGAPCATIGQALKRAKAESKRVYACGGVYEESVVVDATVDGLAVFRGLDCDTWEHDGSVAQVKPAVEGVAWAVEGVAWTVEGLVVGLSVYDFAIASKDATTAGSSSIAAIVRDSKNVVFRDTSFQAGKGAKGADGVDGVKGVDGKVAGPGQKGIAATCTSAPPSHTGGGWDLADIICASEGGTGGFVLRGLAGQDGLPGTPATNLVETGKGVGGPGSGSVAEPGTNGTAGSDGNPGANGALALGEATFSASGYAAASGNAGTDGFPGQGGGGGGAGASLENCTGASGGAGGMGGCGGKLGTGGKGGGASDALVSWSSELTPDKCVLTADGGAGGKGEIGGARGELTLGADGGAAKTNVPVMARGGNGGAGAQLHDGFCALQRPGAPLTSMRRAIR